MRTIEYSCDKGHTVEILQSVHDAEAAPVCQKCNTRMEWTPTKVPLGRFKFDQSRAGRDTGVYDYDYGTRATWDLTVPGKMDKLARDGRIARDPFDEFDEDVRKGKVARYDSSVETI